MSGLRQRADAAAQVLVGDLDAPTVAEADAHHLRRVLRLRDGERVVACDGRGSWRTCSFRADGSLEPVSAVVVEPAPAQPVAVWLPALKGERAEWAVAKLTELGVDEIGLLACDHATVRLDAEAAARVLGRWARVAREAACQSRRTRLPAITGPLDVAAAVATGAVRCDLDGEAAPGGARALVVGPEGGFSDRERAEPAACASLGETVLRTETAAIVAGARLVEAARHGATAEAQ